MIYSSGVTSSFFHRLCHNLTVGKARMEKIMFYSLLNCRKNDYILEFTRCACSFSLNSLPFIEICGVVNSSNKSGSKKTDSMAPKVSLGRNSRDWTSWLASATRRSERVGNSQRCYQPGKRQTALQGRWKMICAYEKGSVCHNSLLNFNTISNTVTTWGIYSSAVNSVFGKWLACIDLIYSACTVVYRIV